MLDQRHGDRSGRRERARFFFPFATCSATHCSQISAMTPCIDCRVGVQIGGFRNVLVARLEWFVTPADFCVTACSSLAQKQYTICLTTPRRLEQRRLHGLMAATRRMSMVATRLSDRTSSQPQVSARKCGIYSEVTFHDDRDCPPTRALQAVRAFPLWARPAEVPHPQT